MVGFVLTSDMVLLARGPMEVITGGEASILGKDISNSKIFLGEEGSGRSKPDQFAISYFQSRDERQMI